MGQPFEGNRMEMWLPSGIHEPTRAESRIKNQESRILFRQYLASYFCLRVHEKKNFCEFMKTIARIQPVTGDFDR